MDTNITKIGCSFYVLIPKNFIEYYELKNGDEAKIEIEKNRIIITIPSKVDIVQKFKKYSQET